MPADDAGRVTIPLPPPGGGTTTGYHFPAARSRGGGAIVVLAHGAGSGPESDVLVAVARTLAAGGHDALTFAFPYRAAGRRAPDPASRLLATWSGAAAFARATLGEQRPLVLGGRSMGGRFASLLAAEGERCDGLVLLAYPLRPQPRRGHPAPPPRTAHWPHLRVPVLFVSGDRDALCPLDLLHREREEGLAVPSDLVTVPGGDHNFGVGARDDRSRDDVLRQVAEAVSAWVGARLLRPRALPPA